MRDTPLVSQPNINTKISIVYGMMLLHYKEAEVIFFYKYLNHSIKPQIDVYSKKKNYSLYQAINDVPHTARIILIKEGDTVFSTLVLHEHFKLHAHFAYL